MLTSLFSFGTPHTPPTTKEDDLAFLRLIRSRRVGPATFHRLLAEHGSIAAALDALPRIAATAGIRDYQVCPEAVAHAELRAGQRAGARLIRCDDPAYPALLRDIDDAPPVVWVRGDIASLSRPAIALVGARNASSLGLRMARGLARGLAESGNVVVAGLARGIDTVAHESACDTGTVAVMAGGIDVIYPTENAALADAICAAGVLLSEQPPGTAPIARHFPLRNRIISGLSRAVVVVEAAHRSGSLITARQALDQGREVLAVPGHPMDARAAGCNALIRDGAILVRNAEDVLAACSGTQPPARAVDKTATAPASAAAVTAPQAPIHAHRDTPDQARLRDTALRRAQAAGPAMPSRSSGGPADLERRIIAKLGPSPTDENNLIRDLGLTAASVAPAILNLELDGRVVRLPGGRLALAVQ